MATKEELRQESRDYDVLKAQLMTCKSNIIKAVSSLGIAESKLSTHYVINDSGNNLEKRIKKLKPKATKTSNNIVSVIIPAIEARQREIVEEIALIEAQEAAEAEAARQRALKASDITYRL